MAFTSSKSYSKLVAHINEKIRREMRFTPKQTFAKGHARFHVPTLLFEYPELSEKECWDFLHKAGYFVCKAPQNQVDISFDKQRIRRCEKGQAGSDWKKIFGKQPRTVVFVNSTT